MDNSDNNKTIISIEKEMKQSYLDYAMSVIVSRALPDVCDGLKPVHRRILYAMQEGGLDPSKPHRKSALIVGTVLGLYHPHGETAIYDSLARMTQDFSMRAPLIDGQGNFGSIDGDKPAAHRYTEARLAKISPYILEDYDKDTVPFVPNYDNSITMPSVLPTRFPNLLLNGANGIAVGMATNIPPHNLRELIDACQKMLEEPHMTLQDVMQIIKGPDFPTAGIIMGESGILQAYETGKGTIYIRGRTSIEEEGNNQAIVITEIPYQVNKSRMIAKIAELAGTQLPGILDIRDESDMQGIRVVIVLRQGENADVIINRLHALTPLQVSFGINLVALHNGRPLQMGVMDMLRAFLDFRFDVVTKRTAFFLRKAEERAHILLGLAVAVENLDEMIILIRSASDSGEAKRMICERVWSNISTELGNIVADQHKLSEIQAQAILDLRLHRLTGLERDKILAEYSEIQKAIADYMDIIEKPERVKEIINNELSEVREKFGDRRRSVICNTNHMQNPEDLIVCEEMVVIVSIGGYVKRIALDHYNVQKRGGKGKSSMSSSADDVVKQMFVSDTHQRIAFFTTIGKVYSLKVYELPMHKTSARGTLLSKVISIENNEAFSVAMPIPADTSDQNIVLVTSSGTVRRNKLSDFDSIRANGKIAMKLEEGDALIAAHTFSNDTDQILLTTGKGQSIRFFLSELRVFASRSSSGVRGVKLAEGDRVVSSTILSGEDEHIMIVSANGFGKRTKVSSYRTTRRGGQGIITMDVNKRTGDVVAAFPIVAEEDVILVTQKGHVVRANAKSVRISGRNTQGVMLVRLAKGDIVVSATPVCDEEEISE